MLSHFSPQCLCFVNWSCTVEVSNFHRFIVFWQWKIKLFAVAISNAISKILETVFIVKVTTVNAYDSHQFGFKVDHSTGLCTNTMKNVLKYYICYNVKVYINFIRAPIWYFRVPETRHNLVGWWNPESPSEPQKSYPLQHYVYAVFRICRETKNIQAQRVNESPENGLTKVVASIFRLNMVS